MQLHRPNAGNRRGFRRFRPCAQTENASERLRKYVFAPSTPRRGSEDGATRRDIKERARRARHDATGAPRVVGLETKTTTRGDSRTRRKTFSRVALRRGFRRSRRPDAGEPHRAACDSTNAEKRCADVERCGESSSQRLLANRSRARKRRAICSQEEPKTREKAKRVKHASRRALMTETRRDEVPKRVRDAARAATERDARSRARRARLARVTTRRPRRSRRASRASRRRARARESFL